MFRGISNAFSVLFHPYQMTYDQCLDFRGHSLTCWVYGFEFFLEVIERIQGVPYEENPEKMALALKWCIFSSYL